MINVCLFFQSNLLTNINSQLCGSLKQNKKKKKRTYLKLLLPKFHLFFTKNMHRFYHQTCQLFHFCFPFPSSFTDISSSWSCKHVKRFCILLSPFKFIEEILICNHRMYLIQREKIIL